MRSQHQRLRVERTDENVLRELHDARNGIKIKPRETESQNRWRDPVNNAYICMHN